MKEIVAQVRQVLKDNVDEKTIATSQHFFKEKIQSYGVKVPMVNKISKEFFAQVKHRSKADILVACELFWQSGIMEETFVACNWSYAIEKQYEPDDFSIFERWIKTYVNNWASCDTLCNHTVGEFVEKYPQFVEKLKEFTGSDNRWVRRASAVTLIVQARKGLFLNDILEIATRLLTDKDDLVQKGYGWLLKAASEAHQDEIFDFVVQNKAAMPRTALRYAIEKMPQDMRAKAMEK
jgi:3-methyladenine DNA glycosylase AlkD